MRTRPPTCLVYAVSKFQYSYSLGLWLSLIPADGNFQGTALYRAQQLSNRTNVNGQQQPSVNGEWFAISERQNRELNLITSDGGGGIELGK